MSDSLRATPWTVAYQAPPSMGFSRQKYWSGVPLLSQHIKKQRHWMLGAGALGRPRGLVQGGRREEGSGWGTHVYLWWIHVDIWQNQYNIVKLKNKIKLNLKKKLSTKSS